MAYAGKKIANRFNRQTIEFVTTTKDSNGAVLEMISAWDPGSVKPPAHYHPIQQERFTMLEGELHIQLEDAVIILGRGRSITIDAGIIHSMWNESNVQAKAVWRVTPALDTEYLLETGCGLAADNKMNTKGNPGILQSILLLKRFSKEYRLAKPPYNIQNVIVMFLAPLARLAGKKAMYRKYID